MAGDSIQAAADDYLFTADLAVQLFQSSPDAIIVVDAAPGTIRLVNSQAEFMTGYHRSELRGQAVELLIPDARSKQHALARDIYMREPRTRQMGTGLDLVLKNKAGDELPVDISLAPVSTPRGMFVITTIRRRKTIGGHH